jgi:hypothetical protein
LKTLFTIHGGEWLVGDYIERTFKHVNVWVPVKDTGVDLLVSDSKNKQVVSLQVKYAQYRRTTDMNEWDAWGWWTLQRKKIAESVGECDYWIFALARLERIPSDFVIIKPAELLRRLDAIHSTMTKGSEDPSDPKQTVHLYLSVTKDKCLVTRPELPEPDISEFLGNWQPIKELNNRP